MAAAAHIRVAERGAYYALPEGLHGIFVGGGGSVRIPRLIGTARMMDMMLTGRSYGAEEGAPLGFSQYAVANGDGLAKGIELAERIASNAALDNVAVIQALPRIARADPETGLLIESVMAAIAESDDEAKARLNAFLEKRKKTLALPGPCPTDKTSVWTPGRTRWLFGAPTDVSASPMTAGATAGRASLRRVRR